MDGRLDELYREVILDHYQSPRHKGALAEADVVIDGKNPLCGDEITLALRVRDGQVDAIRWSGQGCSICMASASMLSEAVRGKALSVVDTMIRAVTQMMHGHPLPALFSASDVEVLAGVRQFPVRIKCALLPWTTLQEGTKQLAAETSHDPTQHAVFSY